MYEFFMLLLLCWLLLLFLFCCWGSGISFALYSGPRWGICISLVPGKGVVLPCATFLGLSRWSLLCDTMFPPHCTLMELCGGYPTVDISQCEFTSILQNGITISHSGNNICHKIQQHINNGNNISQPKMAITSATIRYINPTNWQYQQPQWQQHLPQNLAINQQWQ